MAAALLRASSQASTRADSSQNTSVDQAAATLVLGFIGFAFRQNRNGPADEPSRAETKAKGNDRAGP
jgi:hypothetical protein